MKVYITRWALTRGIVEAEAALQTTKSEDVLVLANGLTFFTGEWVRKLEDAEADFEDRKEMRVITLQAQVDRLKMRAPKVVQMGKGKLGGQG